MGRVGVRGSMAKKRRHTLGKGQKLYAKLFYFCFHYFALYFVMAFYFPIIAGEWEEVWPVVRGMVKCRMGYDGNGVELLINIIELLGIRQLIR